MNKLNTTSASIDDLEIIAIQYFEHKYPLMDLGRNDTDDRDEIGWGDMLEFAKYLLDYECK